MRRLIQFLTKFRDFLIFLALQFLVLSIFFNTRNYHKAKMVNTSSAVVGWFMEKQHNITKHFDLEDQNAVLLNEVAELLNNQPESFYQLQGETYKVNHELVKRQYTYLPATVVQSTDNKRDNYLTLNKGAAQGIEEGMGVINDFGVAGVVLSVSEHYSLVKTILSENIRLGVKSSKNNEYWFMNWRGEDNTIARIDNVKRDLDVELGDSVVTRGGMGQFPEGILVGTVDEIIEEDGNPQVSLNVKLAVNFSNIYHVYIIKNAFKEEQQELENQILDLVGDGE